MTEKRFTYGNSDKGIALTDELKCEHYYWLSSEDCKDIVDLLNEFDCEFKQLQEENEQLKARIGYLERKIQRERNSTQKQYEKWEKEAETKIKELSEENEQLKQTMQEVAELLSEEVDLFSDKATEHDMCAYVELKELDNKDAYYMAISTKKAIKMLKGDVE